MDDEGQEAVRVVRDRGDGRGLPRGQRVHSMGAGEVGQREILGFPFPGQSSLLLYGCGVMLFILETSHPICPSGVPWWLGLKGTPPRSACVWHFGNLASKFFDPLPLDRWDVSPPLKSGLVTI